MGLSDWINSGEAAPPLTRETLDRAFLQMSKQGTTPRHDCLLDGHVALFMSRHCVVCHAEIRDLTPDENHIRHGEFF